MSAIPSLPPNRPRRRRGTALRVALAVVAAAALGAGWVALQPPAQATAPPSAPPPPAVSVAASVEREIVEWDEFAGRLEAVDRVELRARVAGTIESIHFEPGALVRKGQTLIVIDPKPFAAEVARAEAAVAAAQARLALTGAELARAERLLADRAIAERELDERRNAEREARAALQGAQAALDVARLNLGYTRIAAPIGGRIGRAEVTPGNLVAAGAAGPVLASIVSVSPIYASFDADERAFLKYSRAADFRAQRVPVQLGLAHESGHPRDGHVESVDNRVDPRSGTIRVRALFDNRDGLLTPGLQARIRLAGNGTRRAVLVSERAIGTDQHKRFVFVVGADNRVAYREVRLGRSIDGMRVVEHGLAAGERVVVNGLQRVRPGATVAPATVAMDAA